MKGSSRRPDQRVAKSSGTGFYRSPHLSDIEIIKSVEAHAAGRINWLVGAAESKATRILPRLYERGHTGPLWEHLIS